MTEKNDNNIGNDNDGDNVDDDDDNYDEDDDDDVDNPRVDGRDGERTRMTSVEDEKSGEERHKGRIFGC